MLHLNPQRVLLGATELTNVQSIALDREARRTIEEWTDLGPYAALADVPEQRLTFRITRTLTESEPSPAKPGDQLTLSFRTSPTASAIGIRAISATVVITEITHTLAAGGRTTQRLSAVAISTTGAGDPITDTEAQGET